MDKKQLIDCLKKIFLKCNLGTKNRKTIFNLVCKGIFKIPNTNNIRENIS